MSPFRIKQATVCDFAQATLENTIEGTFELEESTSNKSQSGYLDPMPTEWHNFKATKFTSMSPKNAPTQKVLVARKWQVTSSDSIYLPPV